VTWTFPNGQTVSQAWGGLLTSNGATISAQNAAWNGALEPAATATLGFIGTSGSVNSVPSVRCVAT